MDARKINHAVHVQFKRVVMLEYLQTYFVLKSISSKEGFTGFTRDGIEIITQGSITTHTTNLGINFQPEIIRP
jgi:hypothetical protein